MQTLPFPSPAVSDAELPTAADFAELAALRESIVRLEPHGSDARSFRSGLLRIADQLEDDLERGRPCTYEEDLEWRTLRLFPLLIDPPYARAGEASGVAGPEPPDDEHLHLSEAARAGRCLLEAYRPPGPVAAHWRDALLVVYALLELQGELGDSEGIDHCLEALASAERAFGLPEGRAA